MLEAVSASAISAFRLYGTLAQAKRLPPEANEALQALRAFARSHDGIRFADLPQIEDPTARWLAGSALRYLALLEVLEEGFPISLEAQPHPALFYLHNLRALPKATATKDPVLDLHALNRPWLAAHATRCMTMMAWNSQTKERMAESAVLLDVTPELARFVSLAAKLKTVDPSSPVGRRLAIERDRAAKEALLAATATRTDPASLERAAEHIPDGLEKIWEWAVAQAAIDPIEAPPEVPQSLLKQLGLDKLYGLQISSSLDLSRAASPTPVLDAVARLLEEREILDGQTFRGIVWGARVHGLPGFAASMRTFMRYGLDPQLALLKGYSTNPVAAVSLARHTPAVRTGFGQSKRSPKGQDDDLRRENDQLLRLAEATGLPVLYLGDGWESAKAMHEASKKRSARVAYVENTQSGINYLGTLDGLPFDVTMTLADTRLKKMFDANVVGDWIIPRVMAREKRPKEALSAVVLGFGFVGRGAAEALRDRVAKVIVVDKDPERLREAIEAGFDAVPFDERGTVPAGDYYYSCTGFQKSYGLRALASSPDGATWVNCGSTGDLDLELLHRATKGQVSGVRAKIGDRGKVPEHRTVELAIDGKKIRVLHRGYPYFDGIRDKNPEFVDVMMALRLATLAQAARALKSGAATKAIEALDPGLEDDIAAIVRETYPR
jgi:adenosylhomocysteinase